MISFYNTVQQIRERGKKGNTPMKLRKESREKPFGTRILAFLCVLGAVLFLQQYSRAEVSANLHRREIIGKKSHRVEEEWWEDANGNRVMADDLGWASKTYKYNKKPRCTEELAFDLNGELCVTKDGYAIVRQKWDGNGRLMSRAYYDARENPVIGPEGYHKEENRYDHLKLDRTTHYGIDGELIRSDTVWALLQYQYNKIRKCTRAEYLDADMNPMAGPGGFAVMERTYHNDVMSSEYFYDEKGQLVMNAARGYAGFLQTYEKNKLRKAEYFGSDGNLMMYKGQYAYCAYEYPNRGMEPSRISYYDTEGKLAVQPGGWAAAEYTYDVKKRPKKVTYYNRDNERTMTSDGYCSIFRVYATTGDITREAYYDINDQPVIPPGKGYAAVERTIQSPGRVRDEVYYDTDMNPMVLEDGYHGIAYTWENKQMTAKTYMGLDRKPVNCKEGYAIIRLEYDEDGKNTARIYLNADGEPVDGGKGYTRCEIGYYHEKASRYRYYGIDGNAAVGPEGVFELRYTYDRFSEVSAITCFSEDGSAAVCTDGWHRFSQIRNGEGRITDKAYFGTDGSYTAGKDGWARQTTEYNSKGQVSSRTIYGTDGRPGGVADDCATFRYEYSADNGTLEYIRYYDGKDMPAANGKGYYGVRYIRNEAGTVTGERYLDKSSRPMMIPKGYAGMDYAYNEKGKVSRMTYVDLNDRPVLIGIGYCAVEMDYDEAGTVIRQRFLDSGDRVIYTRDLDTGTK